MRKIICLLILTAAGCGLTGCGKSIIGIYGNCLMPCPASPNCVSSCQRDAAVYVAPIGYKVSRQLAWETILSIIGDYPRSRVVIARDNYIHAEFRSRVFRFVDDMEFLFDEEEPIIHVRSASRLGYSDLGVNRERVENIRERFMRLFPISTDTGIAP